MRKNNSTPPPFDHFNHEQNPTSSAAATNNDGNTNGDQKQEKQKEKRSRPWFIRFSGTLTVLILGLLGLVAPFVVSLLNDIPDEADLQSISVRILKIYPTDPHLLVRLPDGHQRGMEWPVIISFGKKGMVSYILTDEENRRLPGCLATVRGVPLKWTISERFRIWELSCPDKNIQITFEKTKRDFDRSRNGRFIISISVIIAMLFYTLFVFLLEKRDQK